MSVDCIHGSFGSGENCPDCRMDRIEALLERIADVLAPTPEQQEDAAFARSKATLQAVLPPPDPSLIGTEYRPVRRP